MWEGCRKDLEAEAERMRQVIYHPKQGLDLRQDYLREIERKCWSGTN